MKIQSLRNRKISKRKKLPLSKPLGKGRYWGVRKNKRSWRYKKYKKKYISFRQRLVLSKRNLNKKRYYLFFTKKRNNIFLTITDILGKVIISQSAGYCKITTKKKKRSPDTLKTVASSVAKSARLKNIKYLFKFFISRRQNKKIAKTIFESFKKVGLFILQAVIIKATPHGLPMRKKKLKRL